MAPDCADWVISSESMCSGGFCSRDCRKDRQPYFALRTPLPALLNRVSLAFLSAIIAITGTADAQSNYATPYYFSTLAGKLGGAGATDGTGATARFNSPNSVAVDALGNVYVTETVNMTIRKITPSGVVTTLAGKPGISGSSDGNGTAARFGVGRDLGPSGICVDQTGNVYVSDTYNFTIRKISVDGLVTTLAGSAGVAGSDDGTGTRARFGPGQPPTQISLASIGTTRLCVDRAGNLYAPDYGSQTIRKITPAGVVTTLAGTPGIGGHADGSGADASFSRPQGVAVDNAGNLYIADEYNNSIRKIAPDGVVTTLAGSAGVAGSADGDVSVASFSAPYDVAVDNAGNVYVSDHGNYAVRKITPAGTVSTLAGAPDSPGSRDGVGSNARFGKPQGITVDGAGNLYVADTDNDTIRKITPDGTVTTLAGMAVPPAGKADGTGVDAEFNGPAGTALDATGNLYVSDFKNCTIRKISPAQVVSTLAGLAGVSGNHDDLGSLARFGATNWYSYANVDLTPFYGPAGLYVDEAGNIEIADQGNGSLRVATPAGAVNTLATFASLHDSARGLWAFTRPSSVVFDRAGNIYVADAGTNVIFKITSAGTITTFAGTAGIFGGFADGTGSAAGFNHPGALAIDGTDTLYVADTWNKVIRKITPAGVVTTLAGDPGKAGSTDGTGSGAQFYDPNGLTVDRSGNVYVADSGNNLIRKITPAGVVTTIAGILAPGNVDGVGSNAQFNNPRGMTVDNAGTLYVADFGSNTVRKGQIAGLPVISAQPRSQTVASGARVELSVMADGAPAPSYQWYFNGVARSGATGSTLVIANADTANAGDYTVTATNALGTVTSSKATVSLSGGSPASSAGSSSSGGGGSLEWWFAVAVTVLGLWRSHGLAPRKLSGGPR